MINYDIVFDPNGGDLGRAYLRTISPLEFQIILPHIAHIFECLYMSGNSRLPFKYAFEFRKPDSDAINLVMNAAHLPSHVTFYESDGNKLFEIRGPSGGVATSVICYLVTKETL